MTKLPQLRAYQDQFRTAIREALATKRRVIACAPPGAGKTVVAKNVLGSVVNRPTRNGESGHVLFTVRCRGLVDNASNSFNEAPSLQHGLIMSGCPTNGGRSVQVASIDTLLAWYCEGGVYDCTLTFDFIVFDECHSHHPKFHSFLDSHNAKRKELGFQDPYVLGLSATPQAQGLGDIYETIVLGPTTAWLIENNYLCPFRYFRAKEGRLEKLKRRGDEYTRESVSEAMEGLSGDLVSDWFRLAEGRATIGFFPTRAQAKEGVELLRGAGIRTEYVDGKTRDDDRVRIFRDLNDGRIDYLANVGVVERGTDIPRVSCIQLCTSVGSIVRYFQMIGRGSRKHPDIADCLILDHGGNVKRHGFFDDPVNWTLDWSTRPAKVHKAKPIVGCPQCSAMYRGGRCNNCGYQPTARELKAEGLVFVGGELEETTNRKRPRKHKSVEQIWVSALFQAGRGNMTFSQAFTVARKNAENDGGTFRPPRTFVVGGRTYRTIPFRHPDSKRLVRYTYGFTVKNFTAEANPYLVEE